MLLRLQRCHLQADRKSVCRIACAAHIAAVPPAGKAIVWRAPAELQAHSLLGHRRPGSRIWCQGLQAGQQMVRRAMCIRRSILWQCHLQARPSPEGTC